MKIDDIIVGDRVRKDMGDLAKLAESIKRCGLLHPLVIKPDGTLIAGHRRLEAVRLLQWDEVPVTVIDVNDLLTAERDENAERKDFSPTEAVAIGRLIEAQHRKLVHQHVTEVNRAIAARRKAQANGEAVEKSDTPKRCTLSYDVAANAVGMGHTKYNKAKHVVAAAEHDFARFGDLVEQMDKTGKVEPAFREYQRRVGPLKEPRRPPPVRNPALRGHKHRQPNREVQRAVWALDGICDVLDKVPVDRLDLTKIDEWAEALKKCGALITIVARRIGNVTSKTE